MIIKNCTIQKYCFFLVLVFLTVSTPVKAFNFTNSETTGTVYIDSWFTDMASSNRIHPAVKELFLMENGQKSEVDSIIRSTINSHPVIINQLGLVFSNEAKTYTRPRIFTFVLSRATDTKKVFQTKKAYFETHTFNITLSAVVINPNSFELDYSRILTRILTVKEAKKLNEADIKKHFRNAIETAASELIKKTAEEFELNESDDADFTFQVTHINTGKKAKELKPYERDLIQYLHDILYIKAKKRGLKNIRFLPPVSRWDAVIWNQFYKRFNKVSADDEVPVNTREGRDLLIKSNRYLSISLLINKLIREKSENRLTKSHLFIVLSGAGVVKRDINMNKVAVLPGKIESAKRIARGRGVATDEETKDYIKKGTPEIELIITAAQDAIHNLADELLDLCEIAVREEINE